MLYNIVMYSYNDFLNGTDSFKYFLLQLKKSLNNNLIMAESSSINLNLTIDNNLSTEYLFLNIVYRNHHEGKLESIINYLLEPFIPTINLTKKEKKNIIEKYLINQLT